MRHEATIQEIEDWIRSKTDMHIQWDVHIGDAEDEEVLPDILDAQSDRFSEFMKQQGTGRDGDKVWWDSDNFCIIEAVVDAIRDEYDSTDSNKPLWRRFDLRGDDDVDYHGGYVVEALEILRTYEEEKS
jgi:hypothetical protein